MNRAKLISNESYWDLFLNKQFTEQEYFSLEELGMNKNNKMSISKITRLLALTLKDKDKDNFAKYCLEIKTNGSSRSARIPLVRFSNQSQSIWKVIRSLREMERGILDLQDLEYHLKHSLGERKLSMPKKILIILEDKSEKMKETEILEYVKDKSSDANVLCISLEFICKYLNSKEIVDLDKIILDKKTTYLRS